MIFLKSWPEFFKDLSDNPQTILVIAVLLMIILFALSRMNNLMEERGVDRAIGITRAVVSFIMYFIVAPVIIFLFINIIAFVNAVPLLDISFLGKWLYLTFTSYWWLLNCIFQNKDVVGQEETYTINSVIRLIWILLPITLIWIQITKKLPQRLIIIPIIVGTILIARHKKAEETFLTKDVHIETLRQLPFIGFIFDKDVSDEQNNEIISKAQRQVMSIALGILVVAGLGVGVFSKYRLAGLATVAISVFGFVLISPQFHDDKPKKQNKKILFADSLIAVMDSFYKADGPESIEIYKISIKLEEFYNNDSKNEFPDSLCRRYGPYFYDRCH